MFVDTDARSIKPIKDREGLNLSVIFPQILLAA
jgi:hypothetical protein